MVSKSHETDTSESLLANADADADAVAAVERPFGPIGMMAGRNRSDKCR
jgi:hypothetical protein